MLTRGGSVNVHAVEPPRVKTRRDLVRASRALSHTGILDAFGHVSARDGDQIVLPPAVPPGRAEREDLLEMDVEGRIVRGEGRPHDEHSLHRRLYAAREDVGAVVHHHAPAVLPFVASRTDLRPVSRLGAPFADPVPVFDDFSDGDGHNVTTDAEADRIADVLGDGLAVLLAGNGAVVVGETVREATVFSWYLAANAETQYRATLLGDPEPTGDEDALAETAAMLTNAIAVDRVWTYLTGG
jgi:ribulose-5-phosphate 4-epimerase/fuculose-1-phosphate aldolase